MVYEEGTLTMAPGDVLFLYTDGVSEAMDADNVMFTEPRIGEELATAVADGASCESVVQHMLAAVRAARRRRGAVRRRHHAGVPLSRGGRIG